jgi:hypothetical protein
MIAAKGELMYVSVREKRVSNQLYPKIARITRIASNEPKTS